MKLRVPVPLLFALAIMAGDAAVARAQDDGIAALLRRLEQVTRTADVAAYAALRTEAADPDRARTFTTSEFLPGLTNVVIHERDREVLRGTLPGDGYRITADAFEQSGDVARISTWQLDLKRSGGEGLDAEWLIADEERTSTVENLYKLSLNPARQFTARNLRISSDDLDLTLLEGSAFVADTDQGITGFVFVGRGEMRFHPAPKTERGQVRLFSGAEILETRFDALYLRMHPSDVETLIATEQLVATSVDSREFRRADDVFREQSPKTFALDLGDLSRDVWSLLPGAGDLLAEIHTKRFDVLTYARSSSEFEDINLFDRRRSKNIALYTSERRLAAHGPSDHDDDLAGVDVIDYHVDVTATPGRHWIDGVTTLSLRVQASAVNSITLRLAAPLVVRSIVSREFGRLFGLRVRNQSSLVITLPVVVPRDTRLSLTISYGGRLEPVAPDRETLQQYPWPADFAGLTAEPKSLYSTGVYWYPQPSATDYATATLNITVPAGLACVASGYLEEGSPRLVDATVDSPAQKLYVFRAPQPLRYLAFVISRFVAAHKRSVSFASDRTSNAPDAGVWYRSLDLSVDAHPRLVPEAVDLADRAQDIARFYESLLGDVPYPALALALVENDLPGGHSPGYFALLNRPLPFSSPYGWRNDPAAFPGYPEFFIAHEMAHQWWGQAVGWRNYHEQWLSEGFAQYFAALYARRLRGDQGFVPVMRQLRKWSLEQSDQGPIALGYRLGHIQSDSRIFRAIVYNKGAAVLDVLRRLVGDDLFFRGVRRFYRASRFQKVGTAEFRAAMEAETGRPLERFFERWIYNTELPQLKFSYQIQGNDVVLHAEQIGEIFDFPLTVTLQYADQKSVDVTVPVIDRVVDFRVPLTGTLRSAAVSKDDSTPAEVIKN